MQKLLNFASDEEFLSPDEALNVSREPTSSLPSYTKSKKFQWLPSEFSVNESGEVRISSYINNLHPDHHPKLYTCIAKIFEKFVPMFNKVLTALRNPLKNRIEIDYYDTFEYAQRDENDGAEDNEEEDSYEERRIRKPVQIPEFQPPAAPEKIVNLNGRNLQVIVKLANIHLTPDQPEYSGNGIDQLPN